MNKNSEAITLLCSHISLPEGLKPLEPKEWSTMAEKLMRLDMQPESLLDFSKSDFINILGTTQDESERLISLIDRGGSLSFEISKYENIGIYIVTRADKKYPHALKAKLKNSCPPLFYYAGDLDLLETSFAGYVGSRNIDDSDYIFTQKTVAKTAAKGYSVVSGGAKGIDSAAADAALSNGVSVVEYISDSMIRKMKNSLFVKNIRDGNLLTLSVASPSAGFNVGMAMMRNRYIYAQSLGTIVIKSDKGKGGTWAGATDNLKNNWCNMFCRDCDSPGNKELIKLGAAPVNDMWDGDISLIPEKNNLLTKSSEQIGFL